MAAPANQMCWMGIIMFTVTNFATSLHDLMLMNAQCMDHIDNEHLSLWCEHNELTALHVNSTDKNQCHVL